MEVHFSLYGTMILYAASAISVSSLASAFTSSSRTVFGSRASVIDGNLG